MTKTRFEKAAVALLAMFTLGIGGVLAVPAVAGAFDDGPGAGPAPATLEADEGGSIHLVEDDGDDDDFDDDELTTSDVSNGGSAGGGAVSASPAFTG